MHSTVVTVAVIRNARWHVTSAGSGGTTVVKKGLMNNRCHTRRKHVEVFNSATRSKPFILLCCITHLLVNHCTVSQLSHRALIISGNSSPLVLTLYLKVCLSSRKVLLPSIRYRHFTQADALQSEAWHL